MIIGICSIELRLEWTNSLKDKRREIKSLIQRIRSKFNVSIAETDCQDQWRTAIIGIVTVSGEGRHAEKVINQVLSFIEENSEAEVVTVKVELY